jgi:NADPH:quinone reductase-like Zn-dependent oxidoreductase
MTVKLMRSAVIDASVGEVWALLRDFNSHRAWHPAIVGSEIEAGEDADAVGAIRAFRLKDGRFLREQLIALSDREMSLTYCLIEAPIALHDYVARMQVRPVTDGNRSFILWESSFRPPRERAAGLADMVAATIYEAGLQALQMHFGGSPIPEITPQMIETARVSQPDFSRSSGASLDTEAMVIDRPGGPETFVPRRLSVPPPGAQEIRIRHTAIGVNFIDVHCRRGEFDLLGPERIPGVEGAGIVLDIGAGVEGFAIGDRIAYAGFPPGAYTGIRNVPAELAIRLPADIPDRVAAGVFLKGLFADALVHDVRPIRRGETVLLRTAAGGLGLLLAAMAKAQGVRVIGAVSSAPKAEAAAEAGCDHVVVTSGDQVLPEALRLTEGRGVDAVFDAVGGATFDESLQLLAPRGCLVSYGQASGILGARDLDALAVKSITLARPNFAHFVQSRAELERRAARLFGLLRASAIRPRISEFALADAASAHRRLEARDNIGSLILIP